MSDGEGEWSIVGDRDAGGCKLHPHQETAAVAVVVEAPTVHLKSQDPRASNTRSTAPNL